MNRLFLFLIFSICTIKAQANIYPFSLHGKVNLDSGTVKIEIIPGTNYYPENLQIPESKIVNGSFVIQGHISSSIGVYIVFTSNKLSYRPELFVLDKGTQTMTYDIQKPKSADVQNQSMKFKKIYELKTFPLTTESNITFGKLASLSELYNGEIPMDKRAELDAQVKRIYQKQDSTLKEFILENPSSHYAFWKLIFLFNGWGYEPYMQGMYQSFTDSIKNSFAGRALDKNLVSASKVSIGSPFPYHNTVDSRYVKFDPGIFRKNKYTLIDLWFSGCIPCKRQFSDLKQLFETYKDDGFNIIGISTDKKEYREEWLKTAKDFELPWQQYWDIDGRESAIFSINAFPTSLLVDENGTIIAKNISLSELSDRLKKL